MYISNILSIVGWNIIICKENWICETCSNGIKTTILTYPENSNRFFLQMSLDYYKQ